MASTQLKQFEKIETIIFKTNYSADSIEDRLKRIENFLFQNTYEKEQLNDRAKRIFSAIPVNETEQEAEISNQESKNTNLLINNSDTSKGLTVQDPLPATKPKYEDKYNVGVLGAISQIEEKTFGKSFQDDPFPNRVEKLENKLLTRSELLKTKNQSTLDRVSLLLRKAKLPLDTTLGVKMPSNNNGNDSQSTTQNDNSNSESYIVNKTNGYLVNKETGEYLLDNTGNPVSVNMGNLNPLNGLESLFGGGVNEGNLDPSNPISQILLKKQYEAMGVNQYGFPNQKALPNQFDPNYPMPNGLPPELLYQLQMNNTFQNDLDF